jgi:transposase
MLNSTPSLVPTIPGQQCLGRGSQNFPILHRRRGAQPLNCNALKHGLYAVKNPTIFTPVPVPTDPVPRSGETYRQVVVQFQGYIVRAIPEYRKKILLAAQKSKKHRDFRSLLSWTTLILSLVDTLVRLNLAQFRIQQSERNLHFIARHALALIRYDFRGQGITRDADLFLEKRVLSDFYSPSSQESSRSVPAGSHYYFITPGQWAVLEPLLPPAERVAPCGRPLADSHLLLDAIFWKLAHNARWQELPDVFPPMLTCRRFYRRLFLSGRLATLYSALYKDLCTRGMVDLPILVSRGCFEISGRSLMLRPGLVETWQLRTALLFLQQGYQVLRCRFGKRGRCGFEI